MDDKNSVSATVPSQDASPKRDGQEQILNKRDAHNVEEALFLLKQVELGHPDHPIRWNIFKKWTIVIVYCALQVFVSMTSTTYVYIEGEVQAEFGGSAQILTLGQSMFIAGNAVGPVFLGPLS